MKFSIALLSTCPRQQPLIRACATQKCRQPHCWGLHELQRNTRGPESSMLHATDYFVMHTEQCTCHWCLQAKQNNVECYRGWHDLPGLSICAAAGCCQAPLRLCSTEKPELPICSQTQHSHHTGQKSGTTILCVSVVLELICQPAAIANTFIT